MAGAEASETFQTVKTRLRGQIDQNLIRKAMADPQSREDLEAVLIPEATLVNRVAVKSQVSHLAGQCPRTQEATSSLWPRPHQEDFMAVLIPGTNLTKT